MPPVHHWKLPRHVRWIALIVLGLTSISACAAMPATQDKDPASAPGAVTTVTLTRLHKSRCDTAPVTFGQPFGKGDVEHGVRAVVAGRDLPVQTDVKTRHDDGSVRHAVVTIDVPCRFATTGQPVALVAARGGAKMDRGIGLGDVLDSSYDVAFTATQGEQRWSATAREALRKVATAGGCQAVSLYCRRWLNGPLVTEWVVGVPLTNSQGRAHDRLMAYFAVRAYGPAPVERVRTDVTIENAWAYQPQPGNVTYRPRIEVPGHVPYSTDEPLKHYQKARWHRSFWWGASDERPLYAALDSDYLQSTRAVPRYQRIGISESLKNKARQHCPLMQACGQTPHMANTGAQAAIGPLPRWSAAFVVDTDYRLFRWMVSNTNAMGGYGVHYRDQETGEPLSIEAHPCATSLWAARTDRCDVPPHGDDRFPVCEGDCESPLEADAAHHPAPAYTAYLATGDWFYEQEMTFWAAWAIVQQNPTYRQFAQGLVHRTQLRGQAWMLRTLSYAAYLLPDTSTAKRYFNTVVDNNIDWYNERFTNNADSNALGAVASYHSVIYPTAGGKRTGIATWQQSFFTWAVGNLVDLGFDKARPLRDWVSRFQVGTMTDPGFCWPLASAYNLRVRDKRDAPYFGTFAQVYEKSFPELSDVGCDPERLNRALKEVRGERYHYPPGTMVGYPKSSTGFVANFQVGLAAAANAGIPNARQAWSIFQSRSTPTDYSGGPQFAVVPR